MPSIMILQTPAVHEPRGRQVPIMAAFRSCLDDSTTSGHAGSLAVLPARNGAEWRLVPRM